MAKDLDLIGDRYNILNLVFFPIYIFVQLPFVVIVRRIGPRLCVSILVTLWGIVMIVSFPSVPQHFRLKRVRLITAAGNGLCENMGNHGTSAYPLRSV